MFYLTWILSVVFGGDRRAEFKTVQPCKDGWVAVLVDKVNGQEYVCNFVPIKSTKVVVPETVDQLIENGGI